MVHMLRHLEDILYEYKVILGREYTSMRYSFF